MRNFKTLGSILFVIGSLERGGSETFLSRLTPELVRHGWSVTIFCLSQPGPLAAGLLTAGIQVVALREGRTTGSRIHRAARLLISSAKLFGWMLRRKPDIVHFFLPAAYLLGAPLAIAARRPILIMSRRSLNRYQMRHPLATRIERRWHKRMAAILANSARVKAELLGEGCDPTRVHLIHGGVPTAPPAIPRDQARVLLGIDASQLVMIIVANLIPYKGHADLIEALGRVKSELPDGWLLLCVGRDDGIGPDLADLVESRGLTSNVLFVGPSTKVNDFLAAADIGVLTSHEEGFSNAILEYMAASLPVIATNVGGNDEAVLDHETGRLVPAGDPASLAEAILKIARNPELARKMGDQGRRHLAATFSLEKSVEAHARLYRTLLGET